MARESGAPGTKCAAKPAIKLIATAQPPVDITVEFQYSDISELNNTKTEHETY